MFSCIYHGAYGAFFNNELQGPDAQSKVAHQVALRRELPLPVFQKIMDTVSQNLGLNLMGNLARNNRIPNDSNDNYLRTHLQIEDSWIKKLRPMDRALQLVENSETLNNQDRHFFIEKLEEILKKNLGDFDSINKEISAIVLLAISRLLNKENYILLKENNLPIDPLEVTYEIVKNSDLCDIDREYFQNILNKNDYDKIENQLDAIMSLSISGLLNKDNYEIVVNNTLKMDESIAFLLALNEEKLLIENNINLLMNNLYIFKDLAATMIAVDYMNNEEFKNEFIYLFIYLLLKI